ncbi:MAG: HAMP domain-containing protein [Chloroflexi bacterium]|nr:HAMP domain-containing protein [Chloroflexota bacterium]
MDVLAPFRHMGIQKRIMLYVTVGLLVMFSSFVFLGLRSISHATDLVYQERLNIAYTTVGILERDFLHIARDVQEELHLPVSPDDQGANEAARGVLDHLSTTDPFPFFHVTGVWVLGPDGTLIAESGYPKATSTEGTTSMASSDPSTSGGQFTVLSPVRRGSPGVPFATIVTRPGTADGRSNMLVAVHTVSVNRKSPYDPTSYWRAGLEGMQPDLPTENPQAKYHMEVVTPEGTAALGIGEDERPGAVSPHFPVIQRLMADRKAATLVHRPGRGQTFEPHVMAVVPLPSSNFYLTLEQPVDVALALPIQLRQRLVLLATLGFLATLLVAWVTTRHVVKPTEQLTSSAQRMAQGDLERPINVNAQDEIGKLAESLDTMRQKLKEAYQQVEQSNRGLESQVKERTARLAEVLQKVISAQEEERYRLARELHDETAQTLSALMIALDRARDELQSAPPQSMEQILAAKAIANRLHEETRRLILDLRPMVLDDLGLGPAIRWYAETHLEEKGVATTVEVDQRATRLPKHIETSLFRIVQEAVNNIAKHSAAKHARIRLAFQDSVATVVIADDGKGFDVERLLSKEMPTKSFGLLGLQERVRLLNGQVHIRSQENKGTEVVVQIPVVAETA